MQCCAFNKKLKFFILHWDFSAAEMNTGVALISCCSNK